MAVGGIVFDGIRKQTLNWHGFIAIIVHDYGGDGDDDDDDDVCVGVFVICLVVIVRGERRREGSGSEKSA